MNRIKRKENKFNIISNETKIINGVKLAHFFDFKIQAKGRNNSKEIKNSKINSKKYKTQKKGILKYIIKRKDFIEKLIMNYLFLFMISYYLIISTLLNDNHKIKIISKDSYITIKIKGSGNKRTFGNNNFGTTCYYNIAPLPNEVYINGIKQDDLKTIYNYNDIDNNVTLIWKNNINRTSCMFINCGDIIEADLSHFDFSQVTNIHAMFYGCTSLVSVNIPIIYAPNADIATNFFYECSSLEYVNIENFILKDNADLNGMFSGINSKLILCTRSSKLKNFYSGNEFINCKDNLIENNEFKCYKKSSNNQNYINLCEKCGENYFQINNEDTNINCYNNYEGFYLDESNSYPLIRPCYESCKKCDNKGNEIEHNCLSCDLNYIYQLKMNTHINCYKTCEFYFYYNQNDEKYYCTPDMLCSNEKYKLLIPQKNQCIDDCSKDKDYPYEFRSSCFHECPINISIKSETKNFYCEAKCSREFPFEIIKTQQCVNNCSISERQKNLCKINYESQDNKINNEAEEKAVENIKEELTKEFNTSDIDKGTNIVIEQKGSTITISTTENQKNEKSSNMTTIDLGECEYKIKDEYNIPKNKSLYILKIDVKQEGLKIPKIEYEVYYPLFGRELIKLNLTVCENSKIDLSIPVILSDSLDKINSSSDYYNDICYTYTSEDGTDISLSDRKKDFIKNNLTVCEEDCDFSEYDYSYGKAICSCKVKTNSTVKVMGIDINKDKLYESFTNIKNIANINVLKCYKLIFKLDAYKNNYANLVLLFIILLFFVCLFIFYFKGYNDLIKIINMITYFKLNPDIVKKLNMRKKNESKKVGKKFITGKGNNKSDKTIKNNYFRKNKKKPEIKNTFFQFKIVQPVYLLYKDKIRELKINPPKKDNNLIPMKKKHKKNKDIIITSKFVNRLPTLNSTKALNYEQKDMKIELNEEQIYQFFLLIFRYIDSEINFFPYKKAIKLDKRNYLMYYISLIRTQHLLFFSFLPSFDYNSQILKIFLFFFNFTINFTVNALFFDDDTMHKIYTDGGSFNFIYNIPQILYSSLISGLINSIIKNLALSDSNLIELKNNSYKQNVKAKTKQVINILKLKFILFFIISLILLIFFWFYLACFCAVYKNTQLHLIKDTLISFGASMLYPFGIYLLPGIFRIISLKGKNRDILYNISKLLQMI